MEPAIGLLKVRVKRGINLAVRDTTTSDPYLVLTLGHQKLKTKVIKGTCNPVWNEELTLTIRDTKVLIRLEIYDKDKFSHDDSMGVAYIDLQPYVECLKMGLNLHHLPDGTKLDRVQPKKDNCLADESCIVWSNGKVTQDMILRLTNVECGEVEVQIELIAPHGRKLQV